jgi:hypothetical protein
MTSSPWQSVGAGIESPHERPTLSMEQVGALADLMPARQRMLVMVATFASLRYGEVTALRPMDIDLARGRRASHVTFGGPLCDMTIAQKGGTAGC